jgi:hypothetical protein
VGDNLNHEAVGIQKEGGVAVGAISRDGPRRTDDLVAAIQSPFVDTMHIRTRRDQERQMLEPDVMPRVVLGFPSFIKEELRALKVLRAIPVAEARLEADHWHELVEIRFGGVDIWNTETYVLYWHLPL